MPLFHATLKQTNLNKKNSRSTLITRLKLKAQSLPGWKKECKVLYALCLESKDEFLGLNSLNAAKKQEEEHLSVSELQDSRMKNRTNRLPNHQGIGMVNLIRWETVLPGPQRLGRLPKPTNPKNPSPFWVLAKSQDPKGEKSEHQVAQDTTGIQNQKNHAPHKKIINWMTPEEMIWLGSSRSTMVRNRSHLVLSGTHKEKIWKVLRNSLNCRFAACATSAWTELPWISQGGLFQWRIDVWGNEMKLSLELQGYWFLINLKWISPKNLVKIVHLYLPWHTSPRGDLIWGICSQSGEVQRAIPSSNKVLQILGSETFLVSWIPIQKFQSLSTWVGKKENSHRDETRISKKKTSEMLVWKLPLTILAKKLRIDFQSQASTSESNNTSGIRQSPSADIAFAGRTDHGSLSEKLSRTKSAPESYASARSVQGSCRHATAAVQGEFCIFEWNVLTLLRFQMATPNAVKMANT